MNASISRREFLQASGALVVSVLVPFEETPAQGISAARTNLVPSELDSWIAVLPDGRIQAFFGDPRREVDVLSAHIFGYGGLGQSAR